MNTEMFSTAPFRESYMTTVLKLPTHLERNECVDGGGRAWVRNGKKYRETLE